MDRTDDLKFHNLIQVTVKHICGHTSQLFTTPDHHGAAEKAEMEDQFCNSCEDKANDALIQDRDDSEPNSEAEAMEASFDHTLLAEELADSPFDDGPDGNPN